MAEEKGPVKSDISEAAAQMLAQQFAEQNRMEEEAREMQRQTNAQVNQAHETLFKAFVGGSKKTPEYPIPIKQIADSLAANPLFIQPVQLFLAELVKRVNQQISEVVTEMTDGFSAKPPTQPGA